MKCRVCNTKFKDKDLVVPVLRYVGNEKRGDFVGQQPVEYLHRLACGRYPMNWTFDVYSATHDQVMAGQHRATRSRVVVSSTAYPTYASAMEAAALLAACVHRGMPTEVLVRL